MNELRSRTLNAVRRRLLRIWQSRGGGFYGFVALLTFVYLEVIDIAGDIVALAGATLGPGLVLRFVIGNLVDAFVNGIRAAIWPVSWISSFGVGVLSAALLVASYTSYRAIRPAVLQLLTPSDDPSAVALLERS